MLKKLVLLSFACGVAGCSGSESSLSPTAPSSIAAAAPVQEITIDLRGYVMDTAFRPLPGARVEVLDGPSAGLSVIADAKGELVLSGMFGPTTQFRATKDGHETRTQVWNCSVTGGCPGSNNARPWLAFYLTVFQPTVNIAGDYTLTFTADSACTDLPAPLRTRSYHAVVTARPAGDRSTIPGFDLEVTGGNFFGHLTGFPIGAAGDRLSFWLDGGHDPPIVEDLGGNAYLAFSGNAVATLGTASISTITAVFDGWIEHLVIPSPLPGPWYFWQGPTISKTTCDARNHRLTLTKRM